MGGANEICTDKTGTLTTGQMTLIECWVNDATHKTDQVLINTTKEQMQDFMQAFMFNCTACFIITDQNEEKTHGNITECAIANALRYTWNLEAK